MEARVLMMSTNNILSPRERQADHRAVAGHRARPLLHDPRAPFAKGEYREDKKGRATSRRVRLDEVRMAYDHGEVHLQAAIKVRMDGEMVETTVGRVLLYEIVPRREIPSRRSTR
jgi:DNA-directed RNA polymerase subunit beta'